MRLYALLVATLVACKLALSFVALDYKTSGQQLMFEWWFLAAIAVYGAIGVLLLPKTGFPGVGTTRRGAMLAAIHGLILGIATIGADVMNPHPDLHHPLPEGLLVYWYGGVISEIWFHLLPVPLILFLAPKKYREQAFWLALLILSAWEGRRDFSIVTYAANASEIWLFRRHGFLAAVAQRMTIYALWHIAWPAFTMPG